jgi:hypothetical protein
VTRLVANFFCFAADAGTFKRDVSTTDSECSSEWRSANKEEAAQPLHRGVFVKIFYAKNTYTPRRSGTDWSPETMNNQPHTIRPRTSAASDNNEREDGGEAELVALAHMRQARCLRNRLILANVLAWIIILVLLKLLISGY